MKKYREFKDYHESIGTIFDESEEFENSYGKFMEGFMSANKDLQEELEKMQKD